MSMDKNTAGLLLDAAKKDPEATADLYKLFSAVEGGPTDAARRWVATNLDKRVQIRGTDMIGRVESLNESDRGFEPGCRYPANILIIKDDRIKHCAKGMNFPYMISQLEVID
ncbi:hypothetical protein [Vibrio phage vB_VmeM-Yong XC32]|nr:hypothetical protein [Vibrio phage vB_VmeM-Yong XC31]QAX96502.1 hypothetical protein [Vibrio phage vB_VmeM-Yong XC32]QAX96819.1 hypothetical protein [Vibrio phage vB_VmeM-Yong MS31]QAX97138.1 hypothetical protein [Vibrio phage vB_VmeM-Yong MS32]